MKITNKQKGFSLIELLIVVAIILIIAAIAIPNLLRARMAANESSAVGSLRTIITSEFNYQQTYGIGYAPLTNLGSTAPCAPATLATSAAACLVDSQLSGGKKSGSASRLLRPQQSVPQRLRTTLSRPSRFRARSGRPVSMVFTRTNPASSVSPPMAPPRSPPAPRCSNLISRVTGH